MQLEASETDPNLFLLLVQVQTVCTMIVRTLLMHQVSLFQLHTIRHMQ